MVFMKLKEIFYRRKLLSKHFFENVYIRDKKLKNKILDWILELEREDDISIDKFEDLFSGYDEIAFPIMLELYRKDYYSTIIIKDNMGKEYEFSGYAFYHYSITKMEGSRWIRCRYSVNQAREILLEEKEFRQKNKAGYFTKCYILFKYGESVKTIDGSETIAFFKKADNETLIKISYCSGDMDEEQILEILFGIANEKKNVNDVFEIVKNLFKISKELEKVCHLTITSYQDSIILSKIYIDEGIVKEYSFPTKISETEICIDMKFPSKKIEEFISEYESRNE